MSAPVFRLKGSGWYETDFKSDKDGQRNLGGSRAEEAKVGRTPKPASRSRQARGCQAQGR